MSQERLSKALEGFKLQEDFSDRAKRLGMLGDTYRKNGRLDYYASFHLDSGEFMILNHRIPTSCLHLYEIAVVDFFSYKGQQIGLRETFRTRSFERYGRSRLDPIEHCTDIFGYVKRIDGEKRFIRPEGKDESLPRTVLEFLYLEKRERQTSFSLNKLNGILIAAEEEATIIMPVLELLRGSN